MAATLSEPLAVDDVAGSHAHLVLRVELQGEHAAVGANREGPILGFAQGNLLANPKITLRDKKRIRAATASS